jgi:hypothetical protein
MTVATAKPAATAAPAIRPFIIETPEADLEGLRARIAAGGADEAPGIRPLRRPRAAIGAGRSLI